MKAVRIALLAVVLSVAVFVSMRHAADAHTQAIYTLPFQGQGYISMPEGCFQCYPGHEGTDYVLGGYQTEGNPVLAAAR